MAQSRGKKDGVKAPLQLSEIEIASQFHLRTKDDAEPLQHSNFRQRYTNRLTKANDPVGGQATAQFALLKYRHGMTATNQFSGTREAGGPGTNDGYFATGGRPCIDYLDSARLQMIHGVSLETPDGDGFVIGSQHARAFAEFLHGANAGTGGAQ